MDGGSLLEKKLITLTLIIFTFLCFLFLGTRVQADTYCVGCPGASAANCDGNAACGAPCDDPMTMGFNCPTIENALDCIATNMDPDATIRIAQNPTMPLTPYTGPGSTNPIDNTAMMMDQEINIQGGWDAMGCTSQTLPLDPTNTIIEAPSMDRVFLIDNTTSDLLTVTLQGLTITGGNPTGNCGPGMLSGPNGAGVCATSTSGSGGLNYTSISNIYKENNATSPQGKGGGLAVIAGGGEDIVFVSGMMMGGGDTFTNNTADEDGGGILLAATGAMLDATIHNATIGGDDPFPNGGNEGNQGGGMSIRGEGGSVIVSNQGNLIANNTAVDGFGGGGVIIINKSGNTEPVTTSISEDEITFNAADGDHGGGITIEAESNTTINTSISKTEIGNNNAGTFGGGIALRGDGNINLNPVVNNIIHHNIAEGSPLGGGGVAAVTSGADANFDIKFVNNTIADNQAPNAGGQGGGILADNTANGVINWTLPNDIIFFNISAGTGDQNALVENGTTCMPPSPADCATIAVRFTDISNALGDIVGIGTGVGFVNLVDPNIFNIDPQFIDHFNGDYRITSDSPVATAGTKTPILTIAGVEADPPDFDIVGTPRDISMGPYEPVPSPTPTPTPTVSPTPSPTPTTPPTPTPTPTIPPPTPTPTPQDTLTFPNANNGKIVTIESEPGTTIQGGPLGKTLNGCPEVFNDQFLTFPVGAYEYFITGLNPGDATTVVIDLPPGVNVNSYFKFGKTPDNFNDHCYEFLFDPQTGTGAQIMNGTIIVHHVDGERGDDDLTPNGVIVDPAGPGFLSDEPPPPDTGNRNGCSLASSVNSGSAALNLFIPLIPAIAVGVRYLGRRRKKK